MTSGCAQCLQAAQEMALENWLDANGLRSPFPGRPGTYVYDPTKVDESEVEQWAQALLQNDFPDMGYHENYGHGGAA